MASGVGDCRARLTFGRFLFSERRRLAAAFRRRLYFYFMASTPPASARQQVPSEVYVTLAGLVDDQMVQRVFANGAIAVNSGVKKMHLLIQSPGGTVGDGIAIYNYLRSLPIEIITYNGGSVMSIAVLVYLAGKVRKVSKAATFMIHRTAFTFNTPATAEALKIRAEGLLIHDARSEAILRQHIEMPAEKWHIHERGDLTLSADDSVKFGIAHEFADFLPPAGNQIFNV